MAEKWLTPDQEKRLTKAKAALKKQGRRASQKESKEPRDLAVITLLLNTGLRVSELCSLRWSDIIFRKGNNSTSILLSKKSNGRQRELPLNGDAVTALTALGYAHKHKDHNAYVLRGLRGGKRLSPRAVQQLVKSYSAKANYDELTPTTLRHTFSKRIIDLAATNGAASKAGAILAGLTDRQKACATQYEEKKYVNMADYKTAVGWISETQLPAIIEAD